eukprot:m.153525 g.153525  ORF g.153525 m.153525 type:complete len:115 (+) comp30839_c0_seq1:157-501(+)
MRTWMQMATPSSRRLRIVSRQLSMMNADPELLCPDPELLCTNVGTIGLHVVLNRPSKLNALSMTIIDLLQGNLLTFVNVCNRHSLCKIGFDNGLFTCVHVQQHLTALYHTGQSK